MRNLQILTSLLLIGGFCLACRPAMGPPWGQPEATQGPVEIMLLSFQPDGGPNLLVEDFMERHPDITVTSYPARRWGWGRELVNRLRQEATESSEEIAIPDVVQAPADFLASLGQEGYLLDIAPFMYGQESLNPDDFYPELIEPFRLGDQLFVLPVSIDLVMLFYNAKLFAEKGVAPPTAEWTWDDMLEAAVRIAEPDATPPTYGLVVIELLPLFLQQGASLVDDPVVPTRFTLNSDEMVEVVTWLRDLEDFYRVSPPMSDVLRHPAELFTTITEGRAGMWISAMSFRHYIGDGTTWTFPYGVAPLPQGRYKATTGTIQGIAILKNTNTPRESWEFVHHMVTHLPPGAGPLREFPALRPLAESQEFLNRMPEEGVESYEQSLAFLTPPYNLPGGVEWQLARILQRYLEPVFTEDMDPRDALDAARAEADRVLMPQLLGAE